MFRALRYACAGAILWACGGHTGFADVSTDGERADGGYRGDASAEVPLTCGNGVAEGEEICDGEDFNGETCASATMMARAGGTISCTDECTVDISQCVFEMPGTGGSTSTGGASTGGAGGGMGQGGGMGAVGNTGGTGGTMGTGGSAGVPGTGGSAGIPGTGGTGGTVGTGGTPGTGGTGGLFGFGGAPFGFGGGLFGFGGGFFGGPPAPP